MNTKLKVAAAASVLTLGFVASAQAGTTGTEFQEAYELMVGWVNGFFGRALAIAFLLVGLFMGIARQNLMACGVSIALAFGLVITPTVLENILTATVTEQTVSIEAPQEVVADLGK